MNCPHCGAHLDLTPDICPLCGVSIDKEALYKNFVKKGFEAFETGELEKAMNYYQKALDCGGTPDAEIYIQYANAHDKLNDKQAAGMYVKALAFDFYNDRVHSLLISFYDKHKRLSDLKKWYEKSRGSIEDAYLDKQIKAIESIINFRKNADILPAIDEDYKQKQAEKIVATIAAGFKQYLIMNVVLLIIVIMMAAGVAAALFFKLNIYFIFGIIAFFLLVCVVAVFYMRNKRVREMKKKNGSIEDIFRDFKKNAVK